MAKKPPAVKINDEGGIHFPLEPPPLKALKYRAMNLLEVTHEQFLTHLRRCDGRSPLHASALYKAFYADPAFDLNLLSVHMDAPPGSNPPSDVLQCHLPTLARQESEEGVTKLAWRLTDGAIVESVIIPMPRHVTVCISSQAGCRMGCRFCETGQMGLRRHLSTAEIVAQVHGVKVKLGYDVRNVVFMGMGEPLDNLDHVIQAVRVMNDQRGLNIALRRITLSTCGLVDGIQRLGALDLPRIKLAVSLNAADDPTRSKLMPVNRRHPLGALKESLQAYPLARGEVFFMEYVLIGGINDRPEHAHQLAHYLEGLPVRLNLIPYNPRRQSPFEAPSEAAVEEFRRLLVDHHLFVRLRSSKGAGIRAACGQLGNFKFEI